MSIYIQKAMNFAEKATPMLHEESDIEHITHKCPHCDGPVKYPLVAREYDVIAFAKLLKIAEQVLDQYGITDKVLEQIYKKIKDLQQRRREQNKDNE